MEDIDRVVASYGIKPIKVSKVTNKVYKIDDGQHQYALKKSGLTNQSINRWEQTFHRAYQLQLSSVLPLILTKHNALYIVNSQDYYYLMPWIKGKQAPIEQMYRSIGKIHKQTEKLQTIDHDQMVYQFSQYKQYCDDTQKMLLSYVKMFESYTYMSPLALQVCTHYRDIELVFIKMRHQITQFIDRQDDALTWTYSLCHGNLKRTHSIQGDHIYLINWEQGNYRYPITDLVTLFKNEIIDYDVPIETWIHSFKVYMEENKLHNHELSLLLIHLLDPTHYMTIIKQYIDQTSNQLMIHQIKKLEITYRQLLFALQLLDFIERNYLSVIPDDFDD